MTTNFFYKIMTRKVYKAKNNYSKGRIRKQKMNKLQIFKNEEFGEVRTTEINNKPYVCLVDICKILGVGNASQLKARLNLDGVITDEVIDNLGRKQIATFVNESNLYKVIFQSRKPEAERFTEWVTSEVLPSIRKTGMYAADDLLENPDLAIKAFQQLKKEREMRKMLEEKVEEQKPKVLFANSVETSESSILIGDLAKLIKQNGHDIGQKRLFKWLRENGYLIKSGESKNMPTQKAMDLKVFEVKERTINNANGCVRLIKTTKVTGKGQIYFVNLFSKF